VSRYQGWEGYTGLPTHRVDAATTKAKTRRASTAKSSGVTFGRLCALAGLPEPVPEFAFHPTRKWRMDWAWPLEKVALEIHGGTFVQGAHSRGAFQRIDFEKWSHAAALGWRIVHVIPEQLESVQTFAYLERCFND